MKNKKSLFSYIKKGLGPGLGVLLVLSPVSFAGDLSPSVNNLILNPYLNKAYKLPENLKEVAISSVKELTTELDKANSSEGGVVFILEEGIYTLDKTLQVLADNIAFISKFEQPDNVIIQGGPELNRTKIGNLFRVSGSHFVLNGITLQNARYHLIQIVGGDNADYPIIRNCILQDAYQQLFKVTYGTADLKITSDFGLIENCTFQYTAGIGPQFYIGGIDAHGINSWVIRNNKFKDIASPGKSIAEHAIHIWSNANNNLVENNFIEDCDRAIGFGMGQAALSPNASYSNRGGVIRNNTIIHSNNNDPFADAGITLEDSPDTLIENNRIWLEHNYPNAIEYRFPSTQNVIIKNNITNKNIVSRNGGKAKLSNNKTNAKREEVLEGYLQ